VRNHLIDYFIPFLPLGINHVKICIQNELKKYPIDNLKLSATFLNDLIQIFQESDYESENFNKNYSRSGCKQVPMLVKRVLIEKGLINYMYLKNEL
jgi:hypothetical protein